MKHLNYHQSSVMRYIYQVVYDAGNLGRTEIESDKKVADLKDIELLERKLEKTLKIRDVVILSYRLLGIEPA